jgi:hypothetical protein
MHGQPLGNADVRTPEEIQIPGPQQQFDEGMMFRNGRIYFSKAEIGQPGTPPLVLDHLYENQHILHAFEEGL